MKWNELSIHESELHTLKIELSQGAMWLLAQGKDFKIQIIPQSNGQMKALFVDTSTAVYLEKESDD